jgi:membrane protein DedA with SNARE-associated domain
MLHWLHSLLPHVPHYGYVLVFIVAFLNNLGVPLPGETILLGAGFVLGKTADSLWQSILTINGGSSSIKFALYPAGEPLKRGLHGKVDRIGLPCSRTKRGEQRD